MSRINRGMVKVKNFSNSDCIFKTEAINADRLGVEQKKKKTDLMSYLNYSDSFHIVIISCQDGKKRRIEIWE